MVGPILIVEDEAALAGLLGDVLYAAGFATVLSTAAQAASVVRESRPALIVVDYVLPGQSGGDVLQHIRAGVPVMPPVLLMTGLANAAELAAEVGAQAYLRKPFDLDVFVATIRALVAANE